VNVRALGLAPPGLGAWTVHVTWNESVVEAVQCGAREGGVCSTTFESNTGVLTATGTDHVRDVSLEEAQKAMHA